MFEVGLGRAGLETHGTQESTAGRPLPQAQVRWLLDTDLGCLLRVTDARFTVSSGSILMLNSTGSAFGALFSLQRWFALYLLFSVFLQGLCICLLIVYTIALDENSSHT